MKLKNNHETSTRAGFQFGIFHLFYVVALVSSGLAWLGSWSLLHSGVILLIWIFVYPIAAKRADVMAAISISAIFALFLLVFLPTVNVIRVRVQPHHTLCLNEMRQLVCALHTYHSSHSAFPEAKSFDKSGMPMHSWRVKILPYLEYQALYNLYDFSEPWDGPNNRKLANQMPEFFKCPSAKDKGGNTTVYKLVCDERALFHEARKPSLDQCPDKPESVLILVEDHDNPVHWMKPEDISMEVAIEAILNSSAPCHGQEETIFRRRLFETNAGFADGTSYPISSKVNPRLIRQMIDVTDGNSPDPDLIRGHTATLKIQSLIAFAMYALLIALPGWFKLRSNEIQEKQKSNQPFAAKS